MSLFELTIQRFQIGGIRAYSRESIAQQLALPGCFVSLARYHDQVVSAHAGLVHGIAMPTSTNTTDDGL